MRIPRLLILLVGVACLAFLLLDGENDAKEGHAEVSGDPERELAQASSLEVLESEGHPGGTPPPSLTRDALVIGKPQEDQALASSKEGAEHALLLEGFVTDPHGNPVEPSSYWVRHDQMAERGGKQVQGWHTLRTENRATESHRFSLHGPLHEGQIDLLVSAPGFHRREMEVKAGTRGLHVVLEPSLTIHGRVTGLTEEQLATARIGFVPSGSRDKGNRSISTYGYREETLDPDGSFQFSGIKEHTDGEILVRIPGVLKEVATVTQVRPWWVGEAGDPRLDPLEIERLHAYSVTVQTKDGGFFNGTQCLVFPVSAAAGEEPYRAYFTGARMQWIDRREELELLICHPNFRVLRTRVKPGQSVLELEPAHFARIALRNEPDIPEGMEVTVQFISSVAHGLLNRQLVLPDPLPTPLPPLMIPEAGTYSFMLTLKEKGMPGHGREILFPSGKPFHTLEVADEPGQVFELTFPNVGVAQAAEEIRVAREAHGERERRRRH